MERPIGDGVDEVNALAAILILALAGCATPGLDTPSGAPEVTVSGATIDQVRGAFVGNSLSHGYAVRSSDPLNMVFEREGSNAESFFLESGMRPLAKHRLKVTLLDMSGQGIRVMARDYGVSNPGTPWEEETEERRGYAERQRFLEQMKAAIEANPDGLGAPK